MRFWNLLPVLFLVPALLSAQQPMPKAPVYPAINPATAKLDQTFTGLDGPGYCLVASPIADLVLAGCESGAIVQWQKDALLGIRGGSGSIELAKHQPGPVIALAWNGGPVVASAGADRNIHLLEAASGKIINTLKAEATLRALVMSPDGKLLAAAGDDSLVHLWDLPAGKPLAPLKDHSDWIFCLAFSADGKQLASGSVNGQVKVWEVAGGKKIKDLPLPPNPPPKMPPDPVPVHSLAFSPDGKTLAIGDADGKIQLITLADGKNGPALAGHTSAVTAIAWHPSGASLASSSKDRTVRLWNPANPQPLKVLEGHTAWVEGLAFFAQGSRLASVSADQTVRIWDLADPTKK